MKKRPPIPHRISGLLVFSWAACYRRSSRPFRSLPGTPSVAALSVTQTNIKRNKKLVLQL
jgi:hypothetical protein